MNANQQSDYGQRLAVAARAVVWVVVVQLFVLGGTIWFASGRHGGVGVIAAVTAALICLVPSILALMSVALTAGTENSLSGVLFSMLLRTVLPFFVTILLVQVNRPLADAGLFGMVLINYLVVLAVESALAVRMIQMHAPTAVGQ